MEKTARIYRFTVTVASRTYRLPPSRGFSRLDSVSAALKTFVSVYTLERVHSLRSRTPKKAKTTICRLVLNLRSQFFQSRLFFSNQEKLRSTTIASAIPQNGAIRFAWQSLPPHQSTLLPTKQMPYPCNHRQQGFFVPPQDYPCHVPGLADSLFYP